MANIAWLVPSLIEGSGGHRTILQNASYLEQFGHSTTLYLENDSAIRASENGADTIRRLFGYEFSDVRVGWNDVQPADLVFATIWYSAAIVRNLAFPCRRAYFVQDWEASFNAVGDTYLFAENSYRYGLVPITIGNWLAREIEHRFAVTGFSFDFCADTSIYHPIPNVRRERAICFICQPEKPRRGARLGIEALGIVKHLMPDVKIYLYGSSSVPHLWFDATHLGLMNLHECNALYNRSAVGLCISSTNPSRIPFEMMAAGLPLVELHRENTLYDLPEGAALLCDQTAESIAEGLLHLLRNDSAREIMSAKAVDFMNSRGQEVGFRQFASAVDWILTNPIGAAPSLRDLTPMYRTAPVVASPFASSVPTRSGAPIKFSAPPTPGGMAYRVAKSIYRAINRSRQSM
ncbi:rhamnosyltransferase WsaF family glycosyltransferase [Caenimonas soli]|uniref:rhamnosyltransferase WsaF family glycosyltransferase n=1 Tax=Caenimonas soli TaxID=2735555 RepID=UPI001557CA7D|nr:glycosyltransferase family 1 protein [Caenimonas soli]NPC57188.1 glycosyltransferase family 1 protein [Caenimonas soli]